MENKIKLLISDKANFSSEVFNKVQAHKELLKLLETEDIISIEVLIRRKESACSADPKN